MKATAFARPDRERFRARFSSVSVRLRCVLVTSLLIGLVAQAGCKNDERGKRRGPRPILGLAAIPVDARVLVGADVKQLAQSPLVTRAVEQMFLRDPELRDRAMAILQGCKLEVPGDTHSVLLAMGALPQPTAPTDQVLMVLAGSFSEPALASCITRLMAESGGRLTTKTLAGRTLYRVEQPDRKRPLWFGFGAEDTLVVSASRDWLVQALSPGSDVRKGPLGPLLGRIDEKAGLWAVGQVDPAVGQGIVTLTERQVAAPPAAMFGELDLSDGVRARLGVLMASEQDANAAVSFMKPQMALLATVAQTLSLGPLVSKLEVDAEAATVYLRVSLSDAEVKQLLSKIDSRARPGQDAGPASAN